MRSLLEDKLVLTNGVELCFDTFGAPADPAILLIAGSGSSMDWWEDEFCERLAAGGRFVIRYDHRDTGQSVTYEPGAPRYTGHDLDADAAGLIETFGLPRAHLVGISMGAGIAQLVALERPRRVASLTLMSTTAAGPIEANLPGMSEEAAAGLAVETPDWSDRDAVIDHMVRLGRVSAARSVPFDEAGYRELAERVVDRSRNIASSMLNHDLLHAQPDDGLPARVADIRTPTLVMHGTEDPFFPFAHGRALAREIPGARLLALGQVGHELPRRAWDIVVPAILEHTDSGRVSLG